MRIFGDPVRTQRLLKMAGMKEGEVIESGMLTRQIEKAQRKVESHNFDIRKNLLLFDDVANDQRKVVYSQRTEIMATEDLSGAIHGLMEDSVGTLLDQYLPRQAVPADWDLQGLAAAVQKDFNTRIDPKGWLEKEPELEEQALRQRVVRAVHEAYDAKVARTGTVADSGVPIMRHVEKQVMLRKLDQHWREHLAAMDYLRQGIHLRGYAQKDYRFEFKREAFEMFAAMLERIKFETSSLMATLEVRTQEEIEREEEERRQRLMRALQAQHAEAASALAGAEEQALPAPPAAPPAHLRSGAPARGLSRRRPRRRRARALSCAASARSAATSRVRAARARSTSTATARSPAWNNAKAWLAARSSQRQSADPGGGGGAVRPRRARPDRAAPAGQASRRPLGIPRRQGGEPARASSRRSTRELLEELGVAVTAARPCMRLTHAYPDRAVELSLWIVEGFGGTPRALDGQRLKWVAPHSTWRTGHSRSRPAVHRRAALARCRRRDGGGRGQARTMQAAVSGGSNSMAAQNDLPEIQLDPKGLVPRGRVHRSPRRQHPPADAGDAPMARRILRARCCSPGRRSCSRPRACCRSASRSRRRPSRRR